MENDINHINDPTLSQEELTEPGTAIKDFGKKIFQGDKVIWSVFIILCVNLAGGDIQRNQYNRLPATK